MASLIKFHCFVQDLAHKIHDLETDQLVVALTDTAPTAATDTTLTNITEIVYTGLSTRNITTTSSAQSSGTYKLTLTDLTLTASGTIPQFQYIVIYNDTSATDALIGYYNYGGPVNLASGESLTIDFDDANGMFQLT